MKLTTRFFLMVWTLVVIAMITLAVLFGRWSMGAISSVSINRSIVRSIGPNGVDSTEQIEAVAHSVTDPRPMLIRRMLLAVVVGSLLAAVCTAALAGPLVGRVTELAAAARGLRSGALNVRVNVRGRDEIAELASSFNTMAAELDASERSRRQLLSDVSHELRTPLTDILGSLEAMQDGLRPLDAPALSVLHNEAMLLVRLVDDLRDVTLADAGELRLNLETLSVLHEANRAAAAFPSSVERAPIVVQSESLPIGCEVIADPARLAQILRNLLNNARAHAPVHTTIHLRVALRHALPGPHVIFTVWNDGPVIPAEHLPYVWDRFYRIDASRNRLTGGMGLGLAVVKRLVELQHGHVSVSSNVSEGTAFTVKLPVAHVS